MLFYTYVVSQTLPRFTYHCSLASTITIWLIKCCRNNSNHFTLFFIAMLISVNPVGNNNSRGMWDAVGLSHDPGSHPGCTTEHAQQSHPFIHLILGELRIEQITTYPDKNIPGLIGCVRPFVIALLLGLLFYISSPGSPASQKKTTIL